MDILTLAPQGVVCINMNIFDLFLSFLLGIPTIPLKSVTYLIVCRCSCFV